MNEIDVFLLGTPMLPRHQVLGASSEDEIGWFNHISEHHSVAPLPNIPKDANNNRQVISITKVANSLTLCHIAMQSKQSSPERLNRRAVEKEMLRSF
jgi:hypothetical protein